MTQQITDIDQIRKHLEFHGRLPDEIHLQTDGDESPGMIELVVSQGRTPSGCQRHRLSAEEGKEEIQQRTETMRSLLTRLRQFREEQFDE